jgi:hypothetical protein
MTTLIQRNYKIADVNMLITAASIIETAYNNKAFLIAKRDAWADPFFEDFKTRIDSTIKDNLGIDNAKELRRITAEMLVAQKKAQEQLAEIKVQIDADFKKEPAKLAEILNVLGFKDYLRSTQLGNQEAIINLLYQFKTNLDSKLKAEIVAKGTNQSTLDTILTYADLLKNTNVSQENAKGSKKNTTSDYVTIFNNLYDDVIAVAKIAANFCKENPTLKEQFSFAKVAANLSANSKTTKVKPTIPKP